MRKRNPLKVILKCALSPELLDCNELNSIFTAETDNLTSLSPKIFVNPFAPTNEIPSVLKNGCANNSKSVLVTDWHTFMQCQSANLLSSRDLQNIHKRSQLRTNLIR